MGHPKLIVSKQKDEYIPRTTGLLGALGIDNVIFLVPDGSNIIQGGPTFSGGGGSNCLFPIETLITCDFPKGVRTTILPGSALVEALYPSWTIIPAPRFAFCNPVQIQHFANPNFSCFQV